MQAHEIPPEQWPEFLARFSREHQGWPTSIELMDPAGGSHMAAQGQQLQGVSLDTKGTQPASVTISVGHAPGAHVRHMVELPLHIRLLDNPPDTKVRLQIEPAQGPQTLLHVRPLVQ